MTLITEVLQIPTWAAAKVENQKWWLAANGAQKRFVILGNVVRTGAFPKRRCVPFVVVQGPGGSLFGVGFVHVR